MYHQQQSAGFNQVPSYPSLTTISSPSAPSLTTLVPINLSLTISLEIEGDLNMNLEKEWIIRISICLIGALTHGFSVTPHALLHIGLDLERFILDRLVRVEATGFGTALRAKIADTYRAFSCYGMVTPLRNTYYRRMVEHSMLTGGQNAHAFLILDAKIEIDNFDLIMRDRALLLGFRQLLKVPDEVEKMAPLNIPGPHESNPSTTFRRILMASSTKPQDKSTSSERHGADGRTSSALMTLFKKKTPN